MNSDDIALVGGILKTHPWKQYQDVPEVVESLKTWAEKLSLVDVIAMALVTLDGSAGIKIIDSVILAERNCGDNLYDASQWESQVIRKTYQKPVISYLQCALNIILPTESLTRNLLALWQMCRQEYEGWGLMYESFERLSGFNQNLDCLTTDVYMGLLMILINEEDAGDPIMNILLEIEKNYGLEYCSTFCKPPLWLIDPKIDEVKNELKITRLKEELGRVRLAQKLADENGGEKILKMQNLESFWFKTLRGRLLQIENFEEFLIEACEEYDLIKPRNGDSADGVVDPLCRLDPSSPTTTATLASSSPLARMTKISLVIALIRSYVLTEPFGMSGSLSSAEFQDCEESLETGRELDHEKLRESLYAVNSLKNCSAEMKVKILTEIFFDEDFLHGTERDWSIWKTVWLRYENQFSLNLSFIQKILQIQAICPLTFQKPEFSTGIILTSEKNLTVIGMKSRAMEILQKDSLYQGRVQDLLKKWSSEASSTSPDLSNLIRSALELQIDLYLQQQPFGLELTQSQQSGRRLEDGGGGEVGGSGLSDGGGGGGGGGGDAVSGGAGNNTFTGFWRPSFTRVGNFDFIIANEENRRLLSRRLADHKVTCPTRTTTTTTTQPTSTTSSYETLDLLELRFFEKLEIYVTERLLRELADDSLDGDRFRPSDYSRVIWLLTVWINFSVREIQWKRQVLRISQMMLCHQSMWSSYLRLYIEAARHPTDDNPSLTTELDVASLFGPFIEENYEALLQWRGSYQSGRRSLWASMGLLRYQTQNPLKLIRFSKLIDDPYNQISDHHDAEMFEIIRDELLKNVRSKEPQMLIILSNLCSALEIENSKPINIDGLLEDFIIPSDEHLPSQRYVNAIAEITGHMRKQAALSPQSQTDPDVVVSGGDHFSVGGSGSGGGSGSFGGGSGVSMIGPSGPSPSRLYDFGKKLWESGVGYKDQIQNKIYKTVTNDQQSSSFRSSEDNDDLILNLLADRSAAGGGGGSLRDRLKLTPPLMIPITKEGEAGAQESQAKSQGDPAHNTFDWQFEELNKEAPRKKNLSARNKR